MIPLRKKTDTKFEREQGAQQRYDDRLIRKEEQSDKKKETKKQRGDEKNGKLDQRYKSSEVRRDERKEVLHHENVQRLTQDKEFCKLRNERRRTHSFYNFQNTWEEEKVGKMVLEVVIPERILIHTKKK